MVFQSGPNRGKAKGLKAVLAERGLLQNGMKQKDMVETLRECDDFKNEKCQLEKLVQNRGHLCVFIPKYHCELNPIENVWNDAKRYCREKCGYNIASLRSNIPAGLDRVPLTRMRKYFNRCKRFREAYVSGDDAIEAYKRVKKSHRKVRS